MEGVTVGRAGHKGGSDPTRCGTLRTDGTENAAHRLSAVSSQLSAGSQRQEARGKR